MGAQALLNAVAQTPWWEQTPTGSRRVARLEPDRPAEAFQDLALRDGPSPRLPDWLHAASAEGAAGLGRVLSRLVWDLLDVSVEGRGELASEMGASIGDLCLDSGRCRPMSGPMHAATADLLCGGMGGRPGHSLRRQQTASDATAEATPGCCNRAEASASPICAFTR